MTKKKNTSQSSGQIASGSGQRAISRMFRGRRGRRHSEEQQSSSHEQLPPPVVELELQPDVPERAEAAEPDDANVPEPLPPLSPTPSGSSEMLPPSSSSSSAVSASPSPCPHPVMPVPDGPAAPAPPCPWEKYDWSSYVVPPNWFKAVDGADWDGRGKKPKYNILIMKCLYPGCPTSLRAPVSTKTPLLRHVRVRMLFKLFLWKYSVYCFAEIVCNFVSCKLRLPTSATCRFSQCERRY
jgi:hypothetical protein